MKRKKTTKRVRRGRGDRPQLLERARRNPRRKRAKLERRYVIVAVQGGRFSKGVSMERLLKSQRLAVWGGKGFTFTRSKAHGYASRELATEHAEKIAKRYRRSDARFGVVSMAMPTRNPSGRGDAGEIGRGESLYERFSGHRVNRRQRIKVRTPRAAVVFGKIVSITYKAVRNGRTGLYEHTFKPGSAPGLATSANGDGLFAVGGHFRVTDRGITDE